MSHIKQQITLQAMVKLKVITLLGISEAKYGEFLIQQGEAYLKYQFCDKVAQKFYESTVFWKWWRNQWHDIDMDFIDEVNHMSRYEMQLYYEILHDATKCEYRPQSALIKEILKGNRVIKHQL